MSSPTWARSTGGHADRARRPDRDHRLPAGEPTSARALIALVVSVIAVKAFACLPTTVLPLSARSTAGSPSAPPTCRGRSCDACQHLSSRGVPVHRQTAASVRSAPQRQQMWSASTGTSSPLVRQSRAGMIGSFAVDASPRIQPSRHPPAPDPNSQHLRSTRCTRCGAGVLRSVGGHPRSNAGRHARVHCGKLFGRRAAAILRFGPPRIRTCDDHLLVVALVGIEQGVLLP